MVIIEGTAFPLDVLNINGWGIPSTEADNAISSLKSSVIRICSRDSPHGCDLSEDPKAEIGHILDAWQDGNRIKVKASITDSTASQKLSEGTWGNGWSVYCRVSGMNGEGWANGIQARSLTLVDNPAWGESLFTVAASEEEHSHLRFFQPFKILVGNTMTETPIPNTGGGIPADFELKLSEKDKLIDTLTNKEADYLKQIEALNTEISGLKTVAASKDTEIASKVTMDEAKAMIASAIQADHEAQSKVAAIEKLTAARKAVGLETKAEDYMTLTASDVLKQAEDFGKITMTASVDVKYKAASSGYVPRMGVFDPVNGFTGGV